jgi:hypothetical protein
VHPAIDNHLPAKRNNSSSSGVSAESAGACARGELRGALSRAACSITCLEYLEAFALQQEKNWSRGSSSARYQAEAAFAKQQQMEERALAVVEYEANARALRERTARLRALRLAKEAADEANALQTTSQKTRR